MASRMAWNKKIKVTLGFGALAVLVAVGVVCNLHQPLERAGSTPEDAAEEETYEGAEPPDMGTSRVLPQAPAGPKGRVGARRVAAFRDVEYYARYEPRDELQLVDLHRALERDPLGFEIHAFEKSGILEKEGGFSVERAGELVALALGSQLQSMGFIVGLEFHDAGGTLEVVEDTVDGKKLELRVAIRGEVAFRIVQTRKEGDFDTTAILVGEALFQEAAGEEAEQTPRGISRVSFSARKIAASKSLEEAGRQPRRVAASALAEAIGQIIEDPELEPALVRFVKERRGGS